MTIQYTSIALMGTTQVLQCYEYDYFKNQLLCAHTEENILRFFLLIKWSGDARTQSPTTKNFAPEFPTFGEIADFNLAECNAQVST